MLLRLLRFRQQLSRASVGEIDDCNTKNAGEPATGRAAAERRPIIHPSRVTRWHGMGGRCVPICCCAHHYMSIHILLFPYLTFSCLCVEATCSSVLVTMPCSQRLDLCFDTCMPSAPWAPRFGVAMMASIMFWPSAATLHGHPLSQYRYLSS